jgi:hypothetical protein
MFMTYHKAVIFFEMIRFKTRPYFGFLFSFSFYSSIECQTTTQAYGTSWKVTLKVTVLTAR